MRRKRERDRRSAVNAMSFAFPPMSDQQLADFLRELAGQLPGELGAKALAELEGGQAPDIVARMVRDELRAGGHLRS